jgi:DNA-directed RNA polymerase beta subunit/intein/homing endonuclease
MPPKRISTSVKPTKKYKDEVTKIPEVPPKQSLLTIDAIAKKMAGDSVNMDTETKDISIQDEEIWAVVNAFFEANGLLTHQIGAFNDLIYNKIHSVLETNRRTVVEEGGQKCIFEYDNLIFERPSLVEVDGCSHKIYPMQCLYRNVTYGSYMYVNVTVYPPNGGNPYVHEKVHLGIMPVMVHADLCNLTSIKNDPTKLARKKEDLMDKGGYFVIAPKGGNGGTTSQRRIIVAQERVTYNKVFVFHNRKSNPKYEIYGEIRSSASGTHTTASQVGFLNNKFTVLLPWIETTAIPLIVVFRALGIVKNEDIITYILGPNYKNDKQSLELLIPSFEYGYECNTQEEALQYIGKKGKKFMKDLDASPSLEGEEAECGEDDPSGDPDDLLNEREDAEEAVNQLKNDAISYARHLLGMEYLPHVGTLDSLEETSRLRVSGLESEHVKLLFHKKALFLGYTVRKILLVKQGKLTAEDRDHYRNKITSLVDVLLAQQFNGALRKLNSEISAMIRKAMKQGNAINILSAIKAAPITNALVGAIANNNWGLRGGTGQGIAQLYEQFNYAAGLANLRKDSVPMARDGGKVIPPRDLHGSHWGVVCPSETPEGKKVGLLKNFALACLISFGTDATPLIKIILSQKVIGIDDLKMKNFNETRIFVNGNWIASTSHPQEIVNALRNIRRSYNISPEVSISFITKSNEIWISTIAGRMMRPLAIVENGQLKIKTLQIEKLVHNECQWRDLLAQGFVEIIDKEEEETCFIANFPSDIEKASPEIRIQYTHCELHPSLIYGIGGSIIPFPERNQCIDVDEPVLMADGTCKKIKDVKIGDKVVSIDPVTGEKSVATVVNNCKNHTLKQMYKITTASGNEVITTYDHRILTYDGWVPCQDLLVNNLESPDNKSLVATALELKSVSDSVTEYTIIDDEGVRNAVKTYDIRPSIFEKHMCMLHDNNYLPLSSRDHRIILLARLFGFSLTDGSIFISQGVPRMAADFGDIESATCYQRDAIKLGLNSDIVPRYTEKEVYGNTWKLEYSGYIVTLLIALGFLPGKKTTNGYPKIPKWIMKGSMLTKQNFLSTFQGGDGCRIRWNRLKNRGINYVMAETSKQVCLEHEKTLMTMMSQIVTLIREFDIEVSDITCKTVKNEPNRRSVAYFISNSHANLIRYFEYIGYMYDNNKLLDSGITIEYLKYREVLRKEKGQLIQDIIQLRKENIAYDIISKKFNIPIKRVYKLTYYKNTKTKGNGVMPHPKADALDSIENWRKMIKTKRNIIFVPIRNIEKVKNQQVADITTDSDNQSFIANRIIVHNSPRNTYQCLDKDTPVLMGDYTWKKIAEVKIGDEVITFHPGSLETSTTLVVNQFVRPTNKKMYEITTFSGRKLIATEDHKIMTEHGWKSVADINVCTDKIAIGLNNIENVSSHVVEKHCILAADEFRKFFVSTKIPLEQHIKLLEKHNLLPLYSDSDKLPIISRVFGFLSTDGSAGIYDKGPVIQGNFDSAQSAEEFESDIEKLGFPKCKYNKTCNELHNYILTTWHVSHGGAIASLMISLGLTIGKFTDVPTNKVPKWIMEGSQLVKREFLSAFQGGDGCKIRYNKMEKRGYNYICAVTQMTKIKKYTNTLISYMEQIVELFNSLGIETIGVKITKSKNIDCDCVGVKIRDTQENLIKFFDVVGYRYDMYKSIESGKVIEYLRYRKQCVEERQILVNRIREAYANNVSASDIAKNLKLTYSYVSDVIRSYKKGRTPKSGRIGNDSPDKWINMILDKNKILFVPIKEIREVENRLIADITTESENHSFIANGFCVHNSAMGKQAIGLPFTNYRQMLTGTFHTLNYLQKPLAISRTASIIQFDEMPAGINAIVAIMPFRFNEEDAIEMNVDSIGMGFMVSTKWISYYCEVRGDKKEEFAIPNDRCNNFKGNISKLEDDAIVGKGVRVEKGDILIGKIVAIDTSVGIHTLPHTNISIMYEHEWPAVVQEVQRGITGDGYPYVRLLLAQRRDPIVGDKFCLTPDHDVLTDAGWIPIANVTKKMKVATLNPKTDEIEYHYPFETVNFDCDEELVEVKNQQIDLCVTRNHKMYIRDKPPSAKNAKYKLVSVEDIEDDVWYKKWGIWNPSGCPDTFTITRSNGKTETILMEAWLEFLGIFIAEGWRSDRTSISQKLIRISNCKERIRNGLERISDLTGWTFCEDGDRHILYHEGVATWLDNNILRGSINKRLPEFVWTLNQRYSLLLLEALCLGDGWKGHGNNDYYTGSKLLADDVQRLALHAGLSANISIKREAGEKLSIKGAPTVRHTNQYRVSLLSKYTREPFCHFGNNRLVRYRGKVYCLSVPNAIFMVRRNGKPVWTGNSARHGQKGIIGMTWKRVDLPFNRDGISPDIIVNALAFPSRMTIAMLVEALTGKKATSDSILNTVTIRDYINTPSSISFGSPMGTKTSLVDATPFMRKDISGVRASLRELGLQDCGDELMYDGTTGLPHRSLTFMCPIYYQRLKHMVIDKVHCLTPDHEVLTESGWKTIFGLSLQDKVATLKDGVLVYEHPLEILYYPNYKGELYHVWGDHVDLCVTKEHRMWVSQRDSPYELIPTSEIMSKSVKYQKDAIWNASDDITTNNERLIYFSMFMDRGVSLPTWIWKLSKRQCRILVDNLSCGSSIISRSVKFADDIMRLILHCGWVCNKVSEDRISFLKRPLTQKDFELDEEMVPYEGAVFCLRVPSEVFYVRRKGNPVWTGNSRARGPKTTISKQPTEGRAADGGLRVGLMERDCLHGQGVARVVRDRLMEQSDEHRMWVCEVCGIPAFVDKGGSFKECRLCNGNKVARIRIPYGTKLIAQELMAMNIIPRFVTTPYGDVELKPLDDAGFLKVKEK